MNKLTERMFEINKKKQEIRSQVESNAEGVDLDTLETELRSLDTEFASIEKRMKFTDGITITKPEGENNMNNNTYTVESPEYRSAFLKNLQGVQLNEVEKRAFDSTATTGGAYVIPTNTANDILTKVKQIAPLLNEITLLHVKGNVSFAVEGTTAEAALHTENGSITGAEDTLVNVSLGGYEVTKLIKVSKTVATMSVNAFETFLVDLLAEAIARKIEGYIINGTGSSQPTGIEKANTWDATNSVTVAKTGSLTLENVLNFIGLLNGGYDSTAKILMSKKTLFSDFMPLQDVSKYNIVIKEGNSYFVYGYPVMLSDSVTLHEAFLMDAKKVVANLSEDINVDSDKSLGTNSIDFLGCAIFDCKPAIGTAFVKLIKATV